ncbi:hypothetical protein Dda_6792 [Drechslerella dactyloides]|uniref:Uncharacterized protein n=1 Tax=Drechslerella dactyloides TaxID=74499 RepID=A0AAD6IU78_DREDA|nr:hypothetical protein Dda_6792 [Drechslerella dactyloides]
MPLWPWKKRSKTNSGDKRPTNNINEGSDASHPPPPARPGSPAVVSLSKTRRRTDTLRSIQRAASRRKNNLSQSSTPPSQLRDVRMSSPPPPSANLTSPTHRPVVQLQSPLQTPPPPSRLAPTAVAAAPDASNNRRSNSSASSHRPRKRNLLKKSPTFPSTDYPSPPPDKDHPRLFRTFSRRSQKSPDSKFRPFARKDQIDRPLSELSMRTQESLHSVMTFHSQPSPFRAFKVRSLDVLSPRPTIRMASSNAYDKMPDVQYTHERKTSRSGWRKGRQTQTPIEEESPTLRRSHVYGLANDLDSRGIREALERDARRRDRKEKEDEAKAQAKLERRAAKQRADEEQVAALEAFAKSHERDAAAAATAAENGQPGPSRAMLPPAHRDGGGSNTPQSPASGTHTPMSWLHGPSQENLHVPADRDRGMASSRISYRSDNGEPVVETATAVRLSGYSVESGSPPPSPTVLRGAKLIDHSPSHSRKMSRDQPVPDNLPDAESKDDNQALENAWTSFFRKATAARVQKEHEAQQEAFRATDSSNGLDGASTITTITTGNPGLAITAATTNGSSTGMVRTFLQSPTPRSTGSRAPSDGYLPDQATPRMSQIAIPVPHEYNGEEVPGEVRMSPLTPSPLTPSRKSLTLGRNLSGTRRPNSKKVNGKSPWSSQGEFTERYGHGSGHFSETSSARQSFNQGHERIRSMASIDSEGSWLSGRLTSSRQSTRRIPSLRDSAASLKLQYHDMKGYEDKRASVADDQFFSGVQDAGSSDEDEHDILSSYLDDDMSIRGSPNFIQYRSPPRSPVSERGVISGGDGADSGGGEEAVEGEDSDTDVAGDQYLWHEGLGRRPIVTRVDSNFVQKREEVVSLDDASSVETVEHSQHSRAHVPVVGELLIEDNDGNVIVPDRGRNSPSPTLGKHHHHRFPKNGTSPFLTS